MDILKLKILTPDKTVYQNEVGYVKVRTLNGDIGILPRHISYAGLIDGGETAVKEQNGNTVRFKCGEGVIHVSSGYVLIAVKYADYI